MQLKLLRVISLNIHCHTAFFCFHGLKNTWGCNYLCPSQVTPDHDIFWVTWFAFCLPPTYSVRRHSHCHRCSCLKQYFTFLFAASNLWGNGSVRLVRIGSKIRVNGLWMRDRRGLLWAKNPGCNLQTLWYTHFICSMAPSLSFFSCGSLLDGVRFIE